MNSVQLMNQIVPVPILNWDYTLEILSANVSSQYLGSGPYWNSVVAMLLMANVTCLQPRLATPNLATHPEHNKLFLWDDSR